MDKHFRFVYIGLDSLHLYIKSSTEKNDCISNQKKKKETLVINITKMSTIYRLHTYCIFYISIWGLIDKSSKQVPGIIFAIRLRGGVLTKCGILTCYHHLSGTKIVLQSVKLTKNWTSENEAFIGWFMIKMLFIKFKLVWNVFVNYYSMALNDNVYVYKKKLGFNITNSCCDIIQPVLFPERF